jgi:hypothetical protein
MEQDNKIVQLIINKLSNFGWLLFILIVWNISQCDRIDKLERKINNIIQDTIIIKDTITYGR